MTDYDSPYLLCYCGCAVTSHREPSFSYGPEMLCRGQGSVCQKAHVLGPEPIGFVPFVGEN